MSSSNGTEYYLKSMNGIKAFDDGSGTVIEDDTITVKTIDCEMITADSFFTDSFNLELLNTTSILSITGNLTVDCDLTTTGTTYTDTISSQTGATGTIAIIGDLQAIKLKSDYIEVSSNISCLNCSADYTLNCITLQADYVNVSSLGNISANTLISPSGTLTIDGNIGATGSIETTGTIYAGCLDTNSITSSSPILNFGSSIGTSQIVYASEINTTVLNSNLSTDNISLYGDITTGALSLGAGQTSGILSLGTALDRTGEIQIGATGCNTVIRGPTHITSGKLTANGGIDTSGTITTSDLIVNNVIKTSKIQPPSLISQIEFFKDTTLPLFFTKFKFENTNITSTATSDIINLFTNLTSGAVNMCSNLIFKASSIASSGVGNIISLFNNLTTGTLNIGAGMTTGTLNIGNTTSGTNNAQGNIIMGNADNSSNTDNNGRVTINKLRVGINGSAYRCKIIGSNIGSGTSGVQSYTIPGAPTTLGNPIVFTQANAQMTTGYIWSVSIQITGVNTFQYWKRIQLGNATNNFTESFNYVAYWI
jgi:hypothetical protein